MTPCDQVPSGWSGVATPFTRKSVTPTLSLAVPATVTVLLVVVLSPAGEVIATAGAAPASSALLTNPSSCSVDVPAE